MNSNRNKNMKKTIIFAAAGLWLGLGIGLATKSWAIGLAMAVLFGVIAFRQRIKQNSRC